MTLDEILFDDEESYALKKAQEQTKDFTYIEWEKWAEYYKKYKEDIDKKWKTGTTPDWTWTDSTTTADYWEIDDDSGTTGTTTTGTWTTAGWVYGTTG